MAVYKLNQKQHRAAGLKWGTIPVQTLEDASLSGPAHRLLMWMLAKPATWGFNVGHIARIFKVNRTTVTRWIKELKDAKYLDSVKIREPEMGYWDWTITVYPLPLPRLIEVMTADPQVKKEDANVIPFSKEA